MKNNILFQFKLCFVISIFILIGCTAEADTPESGNIYFGEKNIYEQISSFRLPGHLDICGERIPLEIEEVHERAEREFYLLLQQPGQIILYLKRAGRFFPMFEEIIRMHNLPEDLKYLAVAESALYQARSHAGAVGLWQFMPETAKRMGLHISDFVDERRHPEKSTHAAMEYLKLGYKQHNNWILTLAGYNMGQTGVKNHLEFQSTDNYFDLFLNEETSRFIFRIAIIKELMLNAEKYGFILSPDQFYAPPKVKTITVVQPIPNLSDWAIEQGTTYKDVKILNPWILKRELRQPLKDNPYQILIPSE